MDCEMDGLEFCKVAFEILEEMKAESEGVKRLRANKTPSAKKLMEEVLPLANFIQDQYTAGRHLRVTWFGRDQPGDALIRVEGSNAEHDHLPREQTVEVTCVRHESLHLAYENLNTQGWSDAPEALARQKGKIVANPEARSKYEAICDLARRVVCRIVEKAAKKYPSDTTLVVECHVTTILSRDEWVEVCRLVEGSLPAYPFIRILVYVGHRLHRAELRPSQSSDVRTFSA